MTAQPSSSTIARALETVLAATAAAQFERLSGLVAPPMATGETDGDLVAVLRENLHAASQHVNMGHESTSFRDCPHPGCRDAANLIPHLETIEAGATDAELDVIFDRVQAALDAGAFADATSEPAFGDHAPMLG